jgi:myo-inositol-1(or 4)-monophosphatase
VPASDVVDVLDHVVTEIRRALDDLEDWGLAGTRDGQYRSDLVADGVAVEILGRAGFGVVSEESGVHDADREIVVVVDPVDGSTNASRGLPWWATSLCALDADGPLAAVVANQATGTRYEAVRGAGARCDGQAIAPTGARHIGEAIVAFSGYPAEDLGWLQFRTLGAAALDLCAVASGALDAFVDCAALSLAPWDYLGGMLICQEAGAHVAEAFGRDLVVREWGPRRTVVAAAGPDLLGEVLAARVRTGPPPPGR